MSNLATAQDFQDCAAGEHGPGWQDVADEFIQRACHWPSEAFWAEWRNIRKASHV